MAHFQERRSGNDRRKFNGKDRRTQGDRRNQSSADLEFIERARFNAWLTMTDKNHSNS